jgi:hypothetical protein
VAIYLRFANNKETKNCDIIWKKDENKEFDSNAKYEIFLYCVLTLVNVAWESCFKIDEVEDEHIQNESERRKRLLRVYEWLHWMIHTSDSYQIYMYKPVTPLTKTKHCWFENS